LSIELTDVLLKPITRIAPTPNGFLHVGNALNAVLVWLWARQNNASIMLRMDDLDRERVRSEYIEDVFRTLAWLGIDWDIGPQTVTEFNTSWSQHKRIDEYDKAIQTLLSSKMAYHCRCSRVKWLKYGYDGCDCKVNNLDVLHETTLRLTSLPDVLSFNDTWIGTQTCTFDTQSMLSALRRRDGQASYQVSTIVDDVLFGVTHIIRGHDLVESTAFQRYLSELIGLQQFCEIQFMHHPLVQVDGGKLSKSAGATSLNHLRSSGMTEKQFYQWVGSIMGFGQISNLDELLNTANMNAIPFSQNQGW
jgi:glutamyl-tRNA synthetase